MALGLNDFDGGKSIYSGLALLVAISGAQKNLDFQGQPLPMVLKLDLSASKS
jgi:hypothetical protein